MAAKIMEMRRKAKGMRDEAESLMDQYRDVEGGMPADVSRRFDTLLDQCETLQREADEAEARERNLNEIDHRSKEGDGGARRDDLLPHNDDSNTRDGIHGYSILKALRQADDQREGRGGLDGLELEVHQELLKRRKRDHPQGTTRGVLVPWDIPLNPRGGDGSSLRSHPSLRPTFEVSRRALDTTAGAGGIPTILGMDMIALLRARLAVVAMGATVLEGLQGLFAIPRQSAAGTGYWLAEAGAPTASNQTIDQVAFSPKSVGAFTDYTRRFLEQTSLDAEAFVRADLAAVVARSLESAALNGTGTSNQPKGILNYSGVSTTATGANGGFPTWALIVAQESAIAASNADLGNLGYMTTPAARGILKSTTKAANFPAYLWNVGEPRTPLNGYPAAVTNLLPSNLSKGTGSNLSACIFGDWSSLLIAMWGGLDLLTDPYTGSSARTVRVVAFQDCDINVRHPESFNKIVDMQTA